MIFDRENLKFKNRLLSVANSGSEANIHNSRIIPVDSPVDIYKSITKEEIRDVARKYLKKNQRAIIDYLPKKDEAQ